MVLAVPDSLAPALPAETRSPGTRRPLAAAVALALGVLAGLPLPVQALSLGVPRLNSALGQPLDLVIPLRLDDPNELDPQCIRLLPAADSDLPTLSYGRLRLERDGLLSTIRVQSLEPIHEPALRVVLEAGCQRRMQRDYVLLIDPPTMRLPEPAQAASALPSTASTGPVARAAIEFGPADIRAVRGLPLQLRVPLRGADASALTPPCVRTVDDGAAPIPLANTRARLLNPGSATPMLEVTSAEPLFDRSVRVVAEVGCERPVRREFDVLVELAPVPLERAAVASTAPSTPRPARPRATPPAAERSVAAAPVVPPLASTAAASETAPAPAAQAPAAAAPTPAARPTDRLVLSAPEDKPVATPANPTPAPTPTDELVKRLDELATEVKRLRTELDAANARNAALTEQLARGNSINIGWAAAAVASLLFAGLLWLSGRRGARRPEPIAGNDIEGPMTRIVGQRSARARSESALPAGAAGAGTIAGAAAFQGAITDIRSMPGSEIQVTEMGDEDAIRELYADFVTRQNVGAAASRLDVATRPADLPPAGATVVDPGSRFGEDVPLTQMTVPLTTQIAVDIDLSQDEPATAAAPAPVPVRAGGGDTATRPLDLDLDLRLDLPEVARSGVSRRG